jgi:hypothetical protein
MTLQVLFIGAGPSGDQDDPVWLAERDGELLIEKLSEAVKQLDAKLLFAVRTADIRRHRLDSVIRLVVPDAAIVGVEGTTRGAPCTALLCIEQLVSQHELLVLNSNETLDIDYCETVRSFRERGLDVGVVAFTSLHPRYSYARLDADGMIEEVAEKHPISRLALAGFTWFRRAADFIEGIQEAIRKEASHDGIFYTSLVLNQLVLRQRRMGVHEVDPGLYHPLKTRRQIAAYEEDASV